MKLGERGSLKIGKSLDILTSDHNLFVLEKDIILDIYSLSQWTLKKKFELYFPY